MVNNYSVNQKQNSKKLVFINDSSCRHSLPNVKIVNSFFNLFLRLFIQMNQGAFGPGNHFVPNALKRKPL
jgi:hypothetical protein